MPRSKMHTKPRHATQSLNFTSSHRQHIAVGIDCPWSEDDRATFMPMARPTDENTYAQILTWMKNRRSERRWEVRRSRKIQQPIARKLLPSTLTDHQGRPGALWPTSPSHPPAFLACPIFDDQLDKPHKAFSCNASLLLKTQRH